MLLFDFGGDTITYNNIILGGAVLEIKIKSNTLKKDLCVILCVVLIFPYMLTCAGAVGEVMSSFGNYGVSYGCFTGGNITDGDFTCGNITCGNISAGETEYPYISSGNLQLYRFIPENTGEYVIAAEWYYSQTYYDFTVNDMAEIRVYNEDFQLIQNVCFDDCIITSADFECGKTYYVGVFNNYCYILPQFVFSIYDNSICLGYYLNEDEQSYSVYANCYEPFTAGGLSKIDLYGTVVIPEIYNGLPVTRIAPNGFYFCNNIEKIVIPATVTTIGDSAFMLCEKLESVDMPYGVEYIGDYAFSECINLATLEIPDSVTYIGTGAFRWCYNLVSVNIPYGISEIADYTFSNCSSLVTIEIPVSVTSIGEGAFSYCESLYRIDIPDSVTVIQNRAFQNCSSIDFISLSGDIDYIGEYTFYGCDRLWSVDLSGNINAIGDFAFADCKNIGYISVGNGLVWMSKKAFDSYHAYVRCACQCPMISYFEAFFPEAYIEHDLKSKVVKTETCEDDGYIRYNCRCCSFTETETLPAHHNFANGVCATCGTYEIDCVESSHYYLNDSITSAEISKPEAESITVKFSTNTYVEVDFDYINIYDAAGKLFGEYTGDELAGAEITVPGDKLKIELVTDESGVYYGYRVVKVKANYGRGFTGVGNTVIDDEHMVIIADEIGAEGLDGIINAKDIADVGFAVNEAGAYGTGSKVNVSVNGGSTAAYTMVIIGDIDGDSECDVLDATLAERAASGHMDLTEAQIYAANGAVDGELTQVSYQNVVNRALS